LVICRLEVLIEVQVRIGLLDLFENDRANVSSAHPAVGRRSADTGNLGYGGAATAVSDQATDV